MHQAKETHPKKNTNSIKTICANNLTKPFVLASCLTYRKREDNLHAQLRKLFTPIIFIGVCGVMGVDFLPWEALHVHFANVHFCCWVQEGVPISGVRTRVVFSGDLPGRVSVTDTQLLKIACESPAIMHTQHPKNPNGSPPQFVFHLSSTRGSLSCPQKKSFNFLERVRRKLMEPFCETG